MLLCLVQDEAVYGKIAAGVSETKDVGTSPSETTLFVLERDLGNRPSLSRAWKRIHRVRPQHSSRRLPSRAPASV